jgi:hypothetical protein
MIYLSGCLPSKPEMQQLLFDNQIGLMLTPFSQRNSKNSPHEWLWAADNGCFAERWDETTWIKWLEGFTEPNKALFATVPDVVADHDKTVSRWHEYHHAVSSRGYKPAFVLQDGADMASMPWDTMGCLFIGGTTQFKLSDTARAFCTEAKSRSIWVHMGRVNSLKRMLIAKEWGVDSTDGTYLAFGPDVNTPKLVSMVQRIKNATVDVLLPFLTPSEGEPNGQ